MLVSGSEWEPDLAGSHHCSVDPGPGEAVDDAEGSEAAVESATSVDRDGEEEMAASVVAEGRGDRANVEPSVEPEGFVGEREPAHTDSGIELVAMDKVPHGAREVVRDETVARRNHPVAPKSP